jgi:hypothetical protein
MKKLSKILRIIAVGSVIAVMFAGCARSSDPKTLAKETYDIVQKALVAVFDPAKSSELEKKLADIEAKVAKLSEEDKAIYEKELARLTGDGLGGLFNAAEDVLNNINTEDVQNTLDTAQDAMDTVKQAADALDAFGF